MSTDERLLRAVFLGFIPGCGAVLAPVVVGIGVVAPDQLTAVLLAALVTEILGLTAGFTVVLGLCGAHLWRVRRLELRSFAAGLAAPLLAGAVSHLAPAASPPAIVLLCGLAGAAAAALAVRHAIRVQLPLALQRDGSAHAHGSRSG